MKCLEKDRSRRYETGQRAGARRPALPGGRDGGGLAPLDRLSAQEVPAAASGPGPGGIDHRPPAGRRHRRDDGRIGAGRTRRGVREAKRKEMAERRLAQIEKGIAILGSIFEDLDPQAEEKEGRPLRAILGDRLDRAAAELDGEAVGDPAGHGRAARSARAGRTWAWAEPPRRRSLFTKALATRRARLGDDHPDTLATRSRLATVQRRPVSRTRRSPCSSASGTHRRGYSGPITETPSPRCDNLALVYWAVGKEGRGHRPLRAGPGPPGRETRPRRCPDPRRPRSLAAPM